MNNYVYIEIEIYECKIITHLYLFSIHLSKPSITYL